MNRIGSGMKRKFLFLSASGDLVRNRNITDDLLLVITAAYAVFVMCYCSNFCTLQLCFLLLWQLLHFAVFLGFPVSTLLFTVLLMLFLLPRTPQVLQFWTFVEAEGADSFRWLLESRWRLLLRAVCDRAKGLDCYWCLEESHKNDWACQY